jgi:hypothetical protein
MADVVANWTLFPRNTSEYLVTVGFSALLKNGPLPVRISDREGWLNKR